MMSHRATLPCGDASLCCGFRCGMTNQRPWMGPAGPAVRVTASKVHDAHAVVSREPARCCLFLPALLAPKSRGPLPVVLLLIRRLHLMNLGVLGSKVPIGCHQIGRNSLEMSSNLLRLMRIAPRERGRKRATGDLVEKRHVRVAQKGKRDIDPKATPSRSGHVRKSQQVHGILVSLAAPLTIRDRLEFQNRQVLDAAHTDLTVIDPCDVTPFSSRKMESIHLAYMLVCEEITGRERPQVYTCGTRLSPGG